MDNYKQSLFEQVNLKPIISKRKTKLIENVPTIPSSNFFLAGEQGIVSLYSNSSYQGLYIDDQATQQNSSFLQNVGSLIMNSGITTTGYLQDFILKKPILSQENNIRYVEFDGIDDFMVGTPTTKSFFSNGTCHGFSIAFKMILGRGVFCWSNPRGNSNSRGFALRISGNSVYIYGNNWATSSDTLVITNNLVTTNWNVLTCQIDYVAGTFRLWHNNTLVKNVAAPVGNIYGGAIPYSTNLGFIPDGSEYGGSKIAKLAFWRAPLSDTTLQRIRTGMGNSIGLTL